MSDTVSKVSALLLALTLAFASNARAQSYDDLVQLFEDWRSFESPPMRDGAPDYTVARFNEAYAELADCRQRLNAFNMNDWPIAQQFDWHIIRA